MANPDKPHGFRYKSRLGGGNGSAPVQTVYAASNIAIAVGDALKIASGYVVPTTTSLAVLGVAQQAVTSKTAVQSFLAIVAELDDCIFEAQMDSLASVAMRYTAHPIVGTTGIQEVDSTTASSTGCFTIIDKHPNSAWSSNAMVLGVFTKRVLA